MIPPAQLARDAASLLATEVAAVVVPHLPAAARGRLGRAAGAVSARLLRGDRRLVADELRRSLGPGAVDPRLLRRCFAQIWLAGVEPHLYPGLGPENIAGLVRLDGEEHLRAALGSGQGVLLLLGHFGLNTLTMAALGHRGYKIHQLSAPPPVWREILGPENVSRLAYRRYVKTWRNEQALPANHISVFEFLRPAYRALRAGEILCVAVDGGGGHSLGRGAVPRPALSRLQRPGDAGAAHRRGRRAGLRRAGSGRSPHDGHRTRAAGGARRPRGAGPAADGAVHGAAGVVGAAPPGPLRRFLRQRRKAAATDARPFFADYGEGGHG